jgi:hypothetical protein
MIEAFELYMKEIEKFLAKDPDDIGVQDNHVEA